MDPSNQVYWWLNQASDLCLKYPNNQTDQKCLHHNPKWKETTSRTSPMLTQKFKNQKRLRLYLSQKDPPKRILNQLWGTSPCYLPTHIWLETNRKTLCKLKRKIEEKKLSQVMWNPPLFLKSPYLTIEILINCHN